MLQMANTVVVSSFRLKNSLLTSCITDASSLVALSLMLFDLQPRTFVLAFSELTSHQSVIALHIVLLELREPELSFATFLKVSALDGQVVHHVPKNPMPFLELQLPFTSVRTPLVAGSPLINAALAECTLAFCTLHRIIQNQHADTAIEMPIDLFAVF